MIKFYHSTFIPFSVAKLSVIYISLRSAIFKCGRTILIVSFCFWTGLGLHATKLCLLCTS